VLILSHRPIVYIGDGREVYSYVSRTLCMVGRDVSCICLGGVARGDVYLMSTVGVTGYMIWPV
jgi:hypothetical protein